MLNIRTLPYLLLGVLSSLGCSVASSNDPAGTIPPVAERETIKVDAGEKSHGCFDSEFRLRVFAKPEADFDDGSLLVTLAEGRLLGSTPSRDGKGIPLPNDAWYVEPIDTTLNADTLYALLRELHAKQVPGVDLRAYKDVDETVIATLRELKSLRFLVLPAGEGERTLAAISDLRAITTLTVPLAGKVTESGWRYLAALPNLECLTITLEDSFDVNTLAGLPRIPTLKTFRVLLYPGSLTDQDMPALGRITQMTELYLMTGSSVSDAGIPYLRDLPRLQAVFVSGSSISGTGLSSLAGIHTLERIGVFSLPIRECTASISDAGVAALCSIPSLRILHIFNGSEITDACLDDIGKLRQLRELSLDCCSELTAGGLRRLGKLRSLERLDYPGFPLTDAEVSCLSEMSELRTLSIAGNQLTDTAFAQICSHVKLERLDMSPVRLTSLRADHITKLPRLTELDLSSSHGATPEVFSILSKNQGLRLLSLRFSEDVSDAGVEHLSKLNALESLDLEACKGVTDAAVPALMRMKTLRELNIFRTSITADGVARLEAALPQTKVVFVK